MIRTENGEPTTLASSNSRKYLRIIYNKNEKNAVQIQSFPFMKNREFDNFSVEFLLLVKPSLNQKETYNQGYRIINLSKNN